MPPPRLSIPSAAVPPTTPAHDQGMNPRWRIGFRLVQPGKRMGATDGRLLFECGISLQDLPGRWGGKFSGFNIDAGLWIWWIVGVLLSRKHAVAV